ncbi:MAG: hypothetical protein Q8K68_03795 [Nitrospirota bacterium]|nr:hypothetical protein [Nitrospirota bacterium]
MKNITICIAVISLMLAAGCTKSVRYSQDEIKDYPSSVQDHIKNNEVTIGMTRAQVRYSWGGPHTVKILSPGEAGKERVEWVYEKLKFFRTRLIFTDGSLSEIISNEPGTGK